MTQKQTTISGQDRYLGGRTCDGRPAVFGAEIPAPVAPVEPQQLALFELPQAVRYE